MDYYLLIGPLILGIIGFVCALLLLLGPKASDDDPDLKKTRKWLHTISFFCSICLILELVFFKGHLFQFLFKITIPVGLYIWAVNLAEKWGIKFCPHKVILDKLNNNISIEVKK